MLEVPANPQYRLHRAGFEGHCRSIGISLVYVEVNSVADVEAAIAHATREHAEALILAPDSFTITHRAKIISAALDAGIATVTSATGFVTDGALASYSPTEDEMMARLAYYVDRILRGAKPAELPVEEPSRFELVINLKTAARLGITIPRSLLVQASELIR